MTGPAVAVGGNPFTPDTAVNPFAPETPPPAAGTLGALRKLNVPLAAADATRAGAPAPNPQAVDLTKGNVAERTLATVGSMAQHPVSTAIGMVTAPLKAAKTAAEFMGQSAAETTLPPDIAARALADPDRISEKDALLAGAQLAIPAAGGRIIGAVASPIAKAVATTATGAATGAAYMPNDPAVGAILGTAATGPHAIGQLRTPPVEAVPAAAPGAPAPDAAAPHVVPLSPLTPPKAAPLMPGGPEERAAGLSVPAKVRDAVSTATSQAFTNPYAPIATDHPALSDALLSAGANTRSTAEAFGRQLAGRVTSGLTPEQAEQFETARVAANLETEAQRKANGAASLSSAAIAHRVEARAFAKRDLEAETDRADQVQQAARAQAAVLGAQTPDAPSAPPELDPATAQAIDAAHTRFGTAVKAGVAHTLTKAGEQRDALVAGAREAYQSAVAAAQDAFAIPADREAHLAPIAAKRDAAIEAARSDYAKVREGARAQAEQGAAPERDAAIAQATAAGSGAFKDANTTYAAQRAAVAAHAQRVSDVLEGGRLDAEQIRKAAQQDHDLAVKMGDRAHDEAQKEAFGKQQAAVRATQEAAANRAKVPAGIEQEPWFQAALEKHNQMVQPFGESAAVQAGVDPAALRTTAVGYARLTPQDRINEELVQRTQETAAAGKSTTPRKGLLRKVAGQKPSVTPLLPAGAEAPLQGPANTLKDQAGSVASPTAATTATGAAKEFKGAENYSTDYVTNVARDLGDKVSKAAKNRIFQALAGEAMKPDATIRKLLPEENVAPGERLIAFNDQKDIIQPPNKNDPNYQTVQRFAVPPDVADAFARYQKQAEPSSNLAKAAKAANSVIMRSVLSNPLVAAGHTLTEASNVSRGLPADQPRVVQAVTGLPGVKSLDAIRRAAAVDMEAPATTARLQRLALAGALRVGDERGQGWVDAAHHALFGPNGIDTRMRLVASQDAEAAWKKAGGAITDPAFTAFERDYVTGASGNYVGKNQGTAVQALNQSGLTPFIAIGRAKLGGSLQSVTGGGGPAGEGLGARILRAQRGPLGQAAAIMGAGYLLSGHAATANAPGHETDMATGVYHLPDGTFKYFRGSPDEAAAQFGAQAKEVYLRKGFLDPSSAAALRLLEPIAFAKKGDRVSESVRAAANTALAFAGPAPALTTQLATGHELYFDRDGALGSVQGVHLSKDADLTDRMVGALRNLNAGAAIGMASPTGGGRSAVSAVLGNLNPFTEARAGTAPRDAADRHDEGVWQDAKVRQIFGEKDPAKRQQIVTDAVKEAADNGFTGPKIRSTLIRAAARANVDRSAAAAMRFQMQIRGGAPAGGSASAAPNPFAPQP